MAYIGIDPNVGDITFQKFTGTGSATAFTLSQAVVSGEAIVVTIGNVVQEPGSSAAYTAQANTLTFSAAPASGDIITVRYFGRAVDQPTSYAMQLFKYVATAGQTAFTGADANGAILVISGNDVDVYLNGVHLDSSDFTASGGDTITLGTGAALNDELVIRAYRAFSVTDTVSKASGGTFSGGVAVTGDLTVDTSTLKVDSTNNRVGVGTTSPTKKVSTSIGLNDTDGYVLEYSGEAKAGMLVVPVTGEVRMGAINSTGTYFSTLYANNSEYMRINSTGKIDSRNRDYGFFNHATNVTLADDASILINPTTLGVGILVIYEVTTGTNGVFRVGYGSCAAISGAGSTTLAAADQDGAVCVFSSGHTLTIKNRLGASKGFTIAMFCAGNGFAG